MLPESAKRILLDEEERQSSYDKNEMKQKMLAQGVYTVAEIEALFDEKSSALPIEKCLVDLGIKPKTVFFEFYSKVGFPPLGQGSELFTLDQILEDYEDPYWGDEYPDLSKRYLQISSIEAQHSYFYDKETDAVYDVGWEEMEDFVAGRLKPQWKSFYDFLDWYYSDDES